MDSKEFVDVIRRVVGDAAVSGTIEILEKPPGRSPPRELIERSQRYDKLTDDQRELIEEVVRSAVDRTIFGFLCVIDGIRAIEGPGQKGRLELWYVKDRRNLLNPPTGPMLHELL